MSAIYLIVLLAALGCMVLLDHRFALVFWRRAGVATAVVVAGVVFLLAWDVFGIGLGIFARGENPYMTGILLAPQLPLEELFFLAFLCYLVMVLVTGADRVLEWLRGRS
ncbi:lycopene cyclase domain-containing protein [Microbacterium sp. STN6]|uniref:lycopene cyclase domain-containing protein n=1 Tax=Microbacterium sp. STN6 TaxID=2995588 RepID=UPI002260FEA4|nr:lycopene cyclase domain-containing protein [Microbacterium sp. STN6]MCX7522646.1 lycopene cyclase domain-containing protein [Microbacterium sp. STN6]